MQREKPNLKHRLEQIRDAQRKHVAARQERGEQLVRFYASVESIHAVDAMIGTVGESRDAILRQAIIEFISKHPTLPLLQVSPPPTTPPVQTRTGFSPPPGDFVPQRNEVRQRRYEILQDKSVAAKRLERNRTARIVAGLRRLLPSNHALAKKGDGRGCDIAERAPRFVKAGRKSQSPEAVLAALDTQIIAWYAIEDQCRAALLMK